MAVKIPQRTLDERHLVEQGLQTGIKSLPVECLLFVIPKHGVPGTAALRGLPGVAEKHPIILVVAVQVLIQDILEVGVEPFAFLVEIIGVDLAFIKSPAYIGQFVGHDIGKHTALHSVEHDIALGLQRLFIDLLLAFALGVCIAAAAIVHAAELVLVLPLHLDLPANLLRAHGHKALELVLFQKHAANDRIGLVPAGNGRGAVLSNIQSSLDHQAGHKSRGKSGTHGGGRSLACRCKSRAHHIAGRIGSHGAHQCLAHLGAALIGTCFDKGIGRGVAVAQNSQPLRHIRHAGGLRQVVGVQSGTRGMLKGIVHQAGETAFIVEVDTHHLVVGLAQKIVKVLALQRGIERIIVSSTNSILDAACLIVEVPGIGVGSRIDTRDFGIVIQHALQHLGCVVGLLTIVHAREMALVLDLVVGINDAGAIHMVVLGFGQILHDAFSRLVFQQHHIAVRTNHGFVVFIVADNIGLAVFVRVEHVVVLQGSLAGCARVALVHNVWIFLGKLRAHLSVGVAGE